LKWVAHDPDATNFALAQLETATTVQEAVDVAHRAGIPAQNFLVVDSTGNLGWTICGKVPKRVGLDGRLPISWAFGDRRWDGYLSSEEVPTIIAPPTGKLWSANQRMLDADALLKLGDGGYTAPARAARIRDDLTALSKTTERDLLAIQLDDHAPQLERWHKLFLSVLNDAAISQKKSRGELRRAAETWEGRAAVDSVSYRLVRLFRAKVRARIFTPLFARCLEQYPNFNFARFNYEPALWKLVEEKPTHFLSANFMSWDDLLLAAVDDVTKELDAQNVPVARATWGRQNVARIRHPLSRFLPGFFSSWLDMPDDQLDGDYDVPRVTAPNHGSSERFVVSPGHEAEGYFHMPGGQSGHPLSPFYKAGHEAWVKGEPTPFLPGATIHTLVLTP
jgi:penicillin amidase